MSEEKTYIGISELLTSKIEELETSFQENAALSAKLQTSTVSLISKVADIKLLVHQLSSDLKQAQKSINNGDNESLKDDIARLTELLSFSYKQPKPERVSKPIDSDDSTIKTVTTATATTDDGKEISDMTIDFDALVNEASATELTNSLRESFISPEPLPPLTEEPELVLEAPIISEPEPTPAVIEPEPTPIVTEPVEEAPAVTEPELTPAVEEPKVITTGTPKRGSVLDLLTRAKIH